MSNSSWLAAVTLMIGTSLALEGHAQTPSRAEQLISYRQAMYTVLGTNFGVMGAVIQGKAPYDAQDFAQRADRVAYMGQMVEEGFPVESRSGAPTKAKPEIWDEKADFDKLLDDMQAKTRALSVAAKGGSLDQVKPAFLAAAQACKACHDRFKEK